MEKKRIALTLLVSMMTIVGLQAQHTKTFFGIKAQQAHTCASDRIHDRLMDEDEDYRRRHQEQEDILSLAHADNGGQRSSGLMTIPIVVHVMHAGEAYGIGSNISDEQVQSAIDGMNEDFRKMAGTNGDGAGVDVEIEFCLAARDPQGNPSNGIVRVDASVIAPYGTEGISAGQSDGANEVDIKNLSKWPREDYYNIWVVNEIEDNDGGAGIQGFAYFPSASVARDGAVILYNAFGTVGSLKSYTSLNRTATHEVGHAFNLYHTFQGNSCTESNCQTQGDRVCDTPPTTANSGCGSPACGGQQQVENYMDYTHESCMDMFTQGQKDRMRTSIENSRSTLLTSLGCTPPNAYDAGITAILDPQGFSCTASVAPTVELTNFGANSLTSVDIRYRYDGGALQSFAWSGNLAPTVSQMVALPVEQLTEGAHGLEVFTESPNGQNDGFQSNDASSTAFEVVAGNVITVAIDVDNYGGETTWDIQDDNGQIIATGGPYPAGMWGTTYEHQLCLAADCYEFTIYDSYGDGICCGGGFGAYSLTDQDGMNLASSGVDFEYEETRSFCVTESENSEPAPSASFTVNESQGCEGTSFTFTDNSTGGVTTRNWTFPGGQPGTSTSATVTVTYPSAGDYDVSLTVTNANGSDTETENDMIEIGAAPSLNAGVTSPSCHDASDGSIDVQLSGGTPPFDYDWSTGANSQDVQNLAAGAYSLEITDALGCEVSGSVNLNAPPALNSSTSSTQSSCNNDGTASVTVDGGTAPYGFLWNDGQSQTSATAQGLAGGDYLVIVTDANGCQTSSAVDVSSTSSLEVSIAQMQDVQCNGGADGGAQVSVQGGNPIYTINWSNGAQGDAQTGLEAGDYTVTVTDADGCQSIASLSIAEPEQLALTLLEVIPDSCDLSMGGATVLPTGGVGPYVIQWDDAEAQDGATLIGVRTGDYKALVQDAHLCEAERNVQIEELECAEVTTVDEVMVGLGLSVFPNPASVGSTVRLELGEPSIHDAGVVIYDITGQQVDVLRWASGEPFIDWNTSTRSSGLYLLQYAVEDGSISQTMKLTITR